MRQAMVVCAVLLFAGLAVGQTVVISGYATNWAPGTAAPVPFVPLLSTPIVSLGSVNLQVGASNATAGNEAGAVNSTMSINTSGPAAQFAQPVWSNALSFDQGQAVGTPAGGAAAGGQAFQWGVASFQDSYGVAQLMSRPAKRASRTYGNPDVAQLNTSNGVVKYAGKTEQVN